MKSRLNWLMSCISLAVWFVILPVRHAEAYWYNDCHGKLNWDSGWTNMYISTTSFPIGSSWDARFQNAMWHWNNIKGSGFNFYVKRDTDGKHQMGNGVNEVYLDNDLPVDGTLAITKVRYHCYWFFGWHQGIDETDMAFNNNYSWTTNTPSYTNLANNTSPLGYESVALHELGHALGLLHEDGRMATMNSFYPASGPLGHWKEWDPLADDREGGRFLYPDRTAETDIAGSLFERSGAGSSALVSSPTTASRGSRVMIEFTFSNQSTSTQSFNIAFYLSNNSYISTADTLLGTNSGAWGSPGFSGTFSRALLIPTSIAPGTYYLGFIVDNTNLLSEDDESNNYMEMPREIQIN